MAAPLAAYAAFDCETTGLDARRDALLQLAAVVVTPDGGREWSTLVDPDRPIDLHVARLTGITPDRVRGAPPPAEALAAFRDFVGDLPLVAHNAPFDLGFVEEGLYRHRLRPLDAPAYDTLELARLCNPRAAHHRLEHLAHARGIDPGRAHDALADARTTAALFAALLAELGAFDPRRLRTMAHFLRHAGGTLGRLVAAVAPAGPPVLLWHWPPSPDPDPPAGADEAPADLQALLRPGSPIAARLGGFEVRPGQGRMLAAVAQAFAADRHLVVEAGTGTGKSLAYLLPALAWAPANRERVVVSTHTVNLQEQLVAKDLPLIAGTGVLPARVALLKGRGQYACLKLWEERLAAEPDPTESGFLARFASWLAETETGDRGELGLYGEDEERFASLSADAVACTGRRCPHFEPCFLFRARRRAEQADVVVVNHALLLSDLAAGGGVLPEYGHLVCDEAHHLEDQACHHLGRTIGERALERFFRLLERSAGGTRTVGLLPALRAALGPGSLAGQGQAAARRVDEAGVALARAQEGARGCADGLRAWCAARQGSGPYSRMTVRLEVRPAAGADGAWDALAEEGERLRLGLDDLGSALAAVADACEDGPVAAVVGAERVAEMRALSGQAAEWAADVALCLGGRDGWVTWCEVTQTRAGGQGAVVLRACPIDPAQILRRDLFGAKRSIVLTSATLSVRGRFDFLRQRLGLAGGDEGERTDELLVGSPFDHRRQALLAVPADAPPPPRGDAVGFARAVTPLLARLLADTRGHALALFTSNRVLREVADRLRPELEPRGIACLAQGRDGSRTALAEALRRGEESVVFGALSFWEGVDLPGDALRCLIIAQLPFWPPDMPLQQARQEAVAARGGSPFRDLQLPQATLRLKQGFGRLIRTTADRGVAVVLDPRLVRADYGRVFRESLPGPTVLVAPGEQVLAAARRWLA